MNTVKLELYLQIMEKIMSELQDVVSALKIEVGILETWAKDQNDALIAAKAAAEAKNVELANTAASLDNAKLEIAALTTQLAAATPGTDETASLVADLHAVVDRLDAITPEPVPEVVVPEKPVEAAPVVEESVPEVAPAPVVDESAVSHELAAPVVEEVVVKPAPEETAATATDAALADLSAVSTVAEEPGSTSTSVPDAGHNGES